MNHPLSKTSLIKSLTLMLMIAFSVNTVAISKKEFRNQGKTFYNGAISDLKNREIIPNLCRFGIDFKSNSSILSFVGPAALDAGLRHQDFIKSIGDITVESPIKTGVSVPEQLINVPVSKGDVVDFVIERNEQIITVPFECPNSRIEQWTYMKDIGYLIMKGKPLECIDAINANEAIIRKQGDYLWLMDLCAGRAWNKRDMTLTDYANGNYERHIAQIDLLFYLIQHVESDALIRKFISERESYVDRGVDWFSRNKKAMLGRNLRSHWTFEKQHFLNDSRSGKYTPQSIISSGEEILSSSGTGFIVTPDGYIATNYHVVEGCSSVKLSDETLSVVAVDKVNDLAVLQSKVRSKHYAFIAPMPPKLSDKIKVYGYPLISLLGKSLSATSGEVSSLSGFNGDFSQFTVSAPIQPGNSGGPIVNEKNEVIGVVVSTLDNVMLASQRGIVSQNVNFGIRANLLMNILGANGVRIPNSPMDGDADFQKITKLLECYKN